jgi:hypothetical protein
MLFMAHVWVLPGEARLKIAVMTQAINISKPCMDVKVKMGGHHLVYGQIEDFLTGQMLEDTDDQRFCQQIGRMLVEEKGYAKSQITPRFALMVAAGPKRAIIPIDFLVYLGDRCCILIKYGPGSLVTRHTPTLAAARLAAPYQVPLAVVTNGRHADVLDTATGKCIGSGFGAIPSKTDLSARVDRLTFAPVPAHQAQMAARILYAYEVDGSCPCDDTICRLPED